MLLVLGGALLGVTARAEITSATPDGSTKEADARATVELFGEVGTWMSGLEVNSKSVLVEYIWKEGGFRAWVDLSIGLDREGWLLLPMDNHQPTIGEAKREIRFRVYIRGPETLIHLGALGPGKKIETQKAVIRFPGWDTLRAQAAAFKPKTEVMGLSLGYSLISYTEDEVPDFSMTALTARFTFQNLFAPPSWDYSGNLFATALPLSSSRSDISARFLGANFRVGYVLPFPEEPFRLSLSVGAYYTTMIVSDQAFGYNSLIYPQFYPTLSYRLKKGSAVSFYGKFVPLGQGLSIGATERELAYGMVVSYAFRSGRVMTFSADAADLKFSFEDGRAISSAAKTFSLGLAW